MTARRYSPLVLVAIAGSALLSTSCRTRQPSVILSPHYKRPAPYVMATSPTMQPKPAIVAQPTRAEQAVQPILDVAPAVPQAAPVVTEPQPLAPVPVLRREQPVVKLEPIEPIPTAQRPAAVREGGYDASTRTWTVGKGDTLWKIGRLHGVSPREIAAANGLNVNTLLSVGQKLQIPRPGEVTVTTAPAAQSTPTARPEAQAAKPEPRELSEYVVSKGDSLWRIARECGVRVGDLVAWNELKSDLLQPGQILRVKGESVQTKHKAPALSEAVVKVSHAPAAAIPTIVTRAPQRAEPAPVPQATPTPKRRGSTRVLPHYVAVGDTLDSIALLYDASKDEILARNPKVKASKRLTPGLRLEVPLPDGRY